MTDKLQSDAVMWGILKAVGVLAVVGVVVGMCRNIGSLDFSSGLSEERGVPVTVLVTNDTPDSVTFTWATKEGALKGANRVPPHADAVCVRFEAHASTGRTVRASFEVQGRDVFKSGWFPVDAQHKVWVDTIRVGRRQRAEVVRDFNLIASHPCWAQD